MANREFRERLKRRAKAVDLSIDVALAEQLEGYYQLLAKWNAKINLTSFRLTSSGEDDAIDRLLIEPVVAARYVPESARTLLDVGSGGGSPAIPLKLANPKLQLRMVEIKTRKAVFLREAIRTLGLRGHVAGAIPRGYGPFAREMGIEAYVGAVVRGAKHDPVLSVQLRRGYEVYGIIPDYVEDPVCANYGVFIVWRNRERAGETAR